MTARIASEGAGVLEHPALLHRSVDDFLAFLVPFVEEGIRRGEPVFVAVGAEYLDALRARVGSSSNGVRWEDTTEWHPVPATRLRAFHELVSSEVEAGASALRLVGEPVWPDGPEEYAVEWARYESVLNDVLGPFPVSLVCTYDSSRLDPGIVENARRTHPVVYEGRRRLAARYEEPASFLTRWNAALPIPPTSSSRFLASSDLWAMRRFLLGEAARGGLSRDRAADLCVAANEVLTNALLHGREPVTVWAWREGDRFLCQIDDAGPGIADPLAGYRPPGADESRGRGLWISRQLVDLLQIVSGPSGTSVRLQISSRLS